MRVCLTHIDNAYKIPYALKGKIMEKTKKVSKRKDINLEEIASLVSEVARNSYGVVAIASDKGSDTKKTKKGNKEEGIRVRKHSDGSFSVDINLVLAFDIKITEALRECQKSIIFTLDKKYPKLCREVNVYVLELR